jgi:hypothetical protein
MPEWMNQPITVGDMITFFACAILAFMILAVLLSRLSK